MHSWWLDHFTNQYYFQELHCCRLSPILLPWKESFEALSPAPPDSATAASTLPKLSLHQSQPFAGARAVTHAMALPAH